MNTKWWKHPEMVWAYSVLGAIAGVVVGIVFFSILSYGVRFILQGQGGWMKAYSGVSGVGLIAQMLIFGGFLGGGTGCALVHAFGKCRRGTGWGLIVAGVLGISVSLITGLDAVPAYGRRFVLSIEGVSFLWSMLFIIAGVILVAQSYCRKGNNGEVVKYGTALDTNYYCARPEQ